MYTAASPDPNPRGGGQLPNPNKCNSTLTSGTRGIYRYLYIYRWRNPVPVQNSFLKRISAISVQNDRLQSWQCLAFSKRQLHFTVFGKSRSMHFPRYASLDVPTQIISTSEAYWQLNEGTLGGRTDSRGFEVQERQVIGMD